MKKYQIEDVKVGVSEGGFACGPMGGSVIAEVCLRDQEEGTISYHSLAETEGIPTFFETEFSIFDKLIADDFEDEEFWNKLSEDYSIPFGDYDDFFESLEEGDPEQVLIWKYLVYMVRAEDAEVEEMKKTSLGKYLGDFEIPKTDLDEEYQ